MCFVPWNVTPCTFSVPGPSSRQAQLGRHTAALCRALTLASSRHTATLGLLSSVKRPSRMFSFETSAFCSHMLAPAAPSAASSSALATASASVGLVSTHSVSAV